MSRRLTDDEQRAIIAHRLSNSATADSELRADRETALDHYYGRPYGNELPGRAQVVTKDLMDTIEWMMPSLLRIFATREAVQFDAVGPEDEELAKQETLYVSHVLWKKNPGFLLIHDWIKDGLMQKVGYIKYWWQKTDSVCFDRYEGLTDEQLVMTLQSLEQQGEVKIVGSEQAEDGTWSIKVRIKRQRGGAKLEVVPPDEIIVDKGCRGSVKDSKMVGHIRKDITRSDLVEMGFDRKRVANLTSYVYGDSSETHARDSVSESDGDEEDSVDWATQELTLLELCTYLDADNDGIAELRRYLLAGNDILENEEAPEIAFDSWSPIRIPHRHVGLSIDDLMEDLQRINTALNRGLLDNVYFTMNPRLMYDKRTVDVKTLQVNRPGGHVANDGPVVGAVTPIPVQPMAGQILPVIDYIAQSRETRTGVGRMTSGVDADVLAQSTKGAYVDAKSAANQRIEAIARMFAETGLSSLYLSLHRLLSRHQDWTAREKLKGEWVEVNPTEWQERANLTVSVGLGNSSSEEVRANLLMMATAQEKAAMVPGLVQPPNVYALFNRMATELGFEQAGFITDPSSPEYQQWQQQQQQMQGQQKDPLIGAEEVKQQANMAGKQLDAQIQLQKLAQERDLKITELELKSGVDLAKAGIGAEVALARGAQAASNRGGADAEQSGAAGGAGAHGAGPAQPDAQGFPGGF